jgi:hypothetical protein
VLPELKACSACSEGTYHSNKPNIKPECHRVNPLTQDFIIRDVPPQEHLLANDNNIQPLKSTAESGLLKLARFLLKSFVTTL